MLVNGDCQWITALHYAFQDENHLVGEVPSFPEPELLPELALLPLPALLVLPVGYAQLPSSGGLCCHSSRVGLPPTQKSAWKPVPLLQSLAI